jgi:hypothetical protein
MPAFRMIRCASMIWATAAQSDVKDAGGEDLAPDQVRENTFPLGLGVLRQPARRLRCRCQSPEIQSNIGLAIYHDPLSLAHVRISRPRRRPISLIAFTLKTRTP